MTPEEKKELSAYIDEKYPPESKFWSRIWDDNCICHSSEVVNPECPNKRCMELK